VRPTHRGSRGAALAETIVALALISLTVVAMLSGFAAVVLLATRHQQQTRLELIVRSDVERLKSQPYSAAGSYTLPAPPAPFTSATLTVSYYNPTACGGGFCATPPVPDTGLQWITVTVSGPGLSERASLFKELP
jgi:Tfp pilus assembly protein PilV